MDVADPAFDRILRALADGTRRALLDRLRDAPGSTLSELVAGFAQTRQALSKHLALLEEADLVVPVWRGREKRHYLNPAPLRALPARWVTATPHEDEAALRALGAALDPAPGAARAAARSPARRRATRLDPCASLLLRPPDPLLQGQPLRDLASLDAARGYLAETAEAMAALLAAMAPREGYEPPSDGSFALVEHIWHLADLEALGWRPRFERILAEAQPRLPGVDGDRLARERHYRERPWRAAARRFIAERRRTLAALARFDEATLGRPVVFAGARTRAGGVVAAAVAHDLDHRPAMAARWLSEHPTRRHLAHQDERTSP